MPVELKPYAQYKDSGVPWLGDIPAHWELHKGKRLFAKMERDIRPEDGVITCFRDGIVTLRKNRRTSGFTESLKEIGYQGIRKGDLVIHMMDAFAGAVGVSDSDGKGTPVYSVCQPKLDLNTYFYSYIVREMARSDYILSLAKGIRERSTDFRFDAFASQILPVPPRQEQDEISAYIRGQSSKINRFIRNKRSLIKLLNEQKQVIINQAVTRGIDPNVSLKPSNVSYLGEIPTHWDVVKLGFFINILPGYAFPSSEFTSNTEDIHLLRGINISPGQLRWSEVVYWNRQAAQNLSEFFLKTGDLVMGMDRPWIKSGMRVAVVQNDDLPCLLLQRVARIRVKEKLNLVFLEYVLHGKTFIDYFLPILTGVSVPHISTGQICIFRLALPPLKAQEEIIEFIREQSRSINEVVIRTQHEIDLIQEYRMRLISDVVTGKVDVRDIEIPALPDEDVIEALEDEELLDAAEAELEAVEDADE